MKAVIFDMYGVIIKQTGDDFVPYVQRTFPHKSHDEIYAPWLKADVGEIKSIDIWKEIGFKGNLEKIEKDYLDTLELKDGFLEFIENVKNSYKTAVISNDSSEWSRYIREKFDINKYFDAISISGDLKIQKPNKEIFLITLKKLGVSPEDCLYIDDREGNLEAAKALGMKTVMLNSRNVRYYGKTADTFNEILKMIEEK